MSDKRETLKPCPFCGSNDLHLHEQLSSDKTVTWYNIYHGPHSECGISITNSNKEETFKRWNTRVSNTLQAENKRLREREKQMLNNYETILSQNKRFSKALENAEQRFETVRDFDDKVEIAKLAMKEINQALKE